MEEELDVWAYCLMINHVHLIIRLNNHSNLSRAIDEVHRHYTRLIPAFCGSRDEITVLQALTHASQKDLRKWELIEIPYTLRKKRQIFYAENYIHKAGRLMC